MVRLTHSNAYGPFDQLDFFVRVGDPDNPTDQDDLDSAGDWVKTELVEELIYVDGKKILRSEAQEPFEKETYWYGTYDAQLTIPAGRQSIDVISRSLEEHMSFVLSGWDITV